MCNRYNYIKYKVKIAIRTVPQSIFSTLATTFTTPVTSLLVQTTTTVSATPTQIVMLSSIQTTITSSIQSRIPTTTVSVTTTPIIVLQSPAQSGELVQTVDVSLSGISKSEVS